MWDSEDLAPDRAGCEGTDGFDLYQQQLPR